MSESEPTEVVSVNLSEDTHVTLYSDGTALFEFMDDDEIVAARFTADEVARLRAVFASVDGHARD